MQLSKGESVSDTGRVLSKYLDLIMVRTFKEKTLLDLARYSSVPVINGLTNTSHPCQVMADILTFEEKKGDIAGKKVVWVGDGNNVCLSYIHAAVKFQFELVVSSPRGCLPEKKHIAAAVEAGGKVAVCDGPREAVGGADLVVTDTFFSMHENSANRAEKLKKFSDYQVSQFF